MAEVINGSDLYVFIDGDVVAHATSHSLSMKMNTRDTSNKDTGKWNTKAVGRLDMSATCDALVVYADFAVMAAALLDRTPVTLAFGERTGAVLTDGAYVGGNLDAASFYGQGSFIITGLDMNAGDQENASYSASFENADGSFAFSTEGTLRAYIAKMDVAVNGESTGFAAVLPAGGTPPYTFLWDDPAPAQTTQAATLLAAGTYTCVVTDDDSDTVTVSCIIDEPEA